MKTKKLLALFILLVTSTIFYAQNIKFGGNYSMDSGSQRMEIIPEGGRYYTVVFKGDCNAKNVEGSVQDGVLYFDIIGSDNDGKIRISQRESGKLEVSVSDIETVRNSCDGASIEGLYTEKAIFKTTNNSNLTCLLIICEEMGQLSTMQTLSLANLKYDFKEHSIFSFSIRSLELYSVYM